MNLIQAQRLARGLMDQYGLTKRGWHFELDKAKSRFGCCKYTYKTITLSKALTEANEEVEVKDTILHEIAHALVGPGHGHGEVWKAKCREIGCRDQRCYTHEYVIPVKAKYQATCEGCGRTFQRHKKTPRGRQHACLCQSHLPWSDKKILKFSVA